jgi:hypothetical protein
VSNDRAKIAKTIVCLMAVLSAIAIAVVAWPYVYMVYSYIRMSD